MAASPLTIATLILTWLRALAAVAAFVVLFTGFFWSPGLILALFVAGFASDSRMLSQAIDRTRRRNQLTVAVRRHRRGWFDAPARLT
jgi:hypothetical protein